MKKVTALFAAAMLVGGVVAASAATVTFTGNASDFISAGVSPLQTDGIDTQTGFCGPDHPLDIDRVFVTNDATTLYIGFDYAHSCFCDMNLGLAFDTKAGGTVSDPFARQIDWSMEASPPDFYVYDVIPTGCNSYNYEVLYGANGSGGWNTIQDGSNGLNIVDTDGGTFVELALPLSQLGITDPCALVNLELFTTQEGSTKPGFDLVADDSQQNSTLSGTNWDTPPNGSGFTSKPSTYLAYYLNCATPSGKKSWGSVKTLYR